MDGIDRLVFPGIVGGCLFLVLVVGFISNPQIVLASTSGLNNADHTLNTLLENNQTDKHLPEFITDPSSIVNWNPPAAAPQLTVAAAPLETPAVQEAAAPEPGAVQEPVDQAAAQVPESKTQGPTGCSLSASYSDSVRQWCELIERYATAFNLPPGLVAALITQESGGDAQAYSSSGAVGLMQVMPRDGLAASFMCDSGPCFASRPSSDQLFDPEYNVAYGTRMLAGLIAKYGDIREALRAYGPHDVGYSYADIVMAIMNSHP
jgi:hypothetical protein